MNFVLLISKNIVNIGFQANNTLQKLLQIANRLFKSTATKHIKMHPPIQITKEKFIKAIDELSQSTAAGPDGYLAISLKNCKTALSEPLVILWKASMESGIVPDILKRSIITPIHKGGVALQLQTIDQLRSHLI